MTITILELYPNQLNLNGDTGNRRALAHRLRLADVPVEERVYEAGTDLGDVPDIVLLGTGTSSAIRSIADDVTSIAPTLREWAEAGVVIFATGAGFHLLGTELKLTSDVTLEGVGIFDVSIDSTQRRVITEGFSVDAVSGAIAAPLIGTENHTAVVSRHPRQEAFGRVLSGSGNGDGTDGAVRGNAIGTHLHGPALVLNPQLADDVIRRACTRSGHLYATSESHASLDAVVEKARAILLKKSGERRA